MRIVAPTVCLSFSLLTALQGCSPSDGATIPFGTTGGSAANDSTGSGGAGVVDGQNPSGGNDATASGGGSNVTPPSGQELCGTALNPVAGGVAGKGHATRYWDCCMPHCSWAENTSNPSAVCSVNDAPMSIQLTPEGNTMTQSGCNVQDGAYTCSSQSPWSACDDLAFGYAAVPLGGPDACGSCFELSFDGRNNQVKYDQNSVPDPGSVQLAGKKMIVMASNTGGDVGGGQFDIMIPGGGVGIFPQGCQNQWGSLGENILGPTHGGMRSKCQEEWNQAQQGGEYQPHMPLADMQTCVKSRCDQAFSDKPNLLQGCYFYADWMGAADNPTFDYVQVECPAALIERY